MGSLLLRYVLGVLVVVSVIGAILFFSSGYFKRTLAQYTGYSTICVDGVKYIQFISGASVKYTTDGSIEKCR